MAIESMNYKKMAELPQASAIVKATAAKLIRNPYLTLSDFFKGLSNNDLAVLSLMAEMIQTDEQSQFDLICLSEMLSRAEGAEACDIAGQTKNVNYFCTLISLISLERKGLVEVNWENLSFGDDMGDKEIARLKQH